MRSRSGEREKERGLRATRTHVEREIDIGGRQRRREKTGKTNRKPTPEAGTREEPLGALSSNRASLETGGSIQTWTFRDSLVAFLFFFSFPLLFLLFFLFFSSSISSFTFFLPLSASCHYRCPFYPTDRRCVFHRRLGRFVRARVFDESVKLPLPENREKVDEHAKQHNLVWTSSIRTLERVSERARGASNVYLGVCCLLSGRIYQRAI